jgi:hypothetical protein
VSSSRAKSGCGDSWSFVKLLLATMHRISNAKPLGNIDYRVPVVDNLPYGCFFELRCVFGSLHLHFSNSDFENKIYLLIRVTHEEIRMIQNRLNNRARKKLEFKTPAEVFHQSLKRVALRT